MPDLSVPGKPIQFKGSSLGVVHIHLQELEPPRLADVLHTMLGGMADFFSGEPAILDVGDAPAFPSRVDWNGLLGLLRRYQVQPIAVANLPPEHESTARIAGLAVLRPEQLNARPASAPASAPAPEAPRPAAPAAATAAAVTTMVIDRPLRSGQQIYAKGGDLVLLGGVSNGAEVIADGSIHCYGPLRGRAIAGANGNTAARILATNFGAELVAIAGVFRTFEKGIPETVAARAAQVRLSGQGDIQTLNIEPLQLS